MKNFNKQRGEGVVSFLISLVLIAIVGAGLYSKFGRGSTTSQANDLAADMSILMSSVKSSYAGNYANVTTARLVASGYFQGFASMTTAAAGTVAIGAGGGSLTVSPGTVGVANDSARYVLTNIPDAACVPLATNLGRSATTLTIGQNNAVKAVGTPFDASQVVCAGDDNTFTIQMM